MLKYLKTLLFFAIAFIITFKDVQTFANHTSRQQADGNVITPKFENAKINEVYVQYIYLKNALMKNDLTKANQTAKSLQKAVSAAKLSGINLAGMVNAKNIKAKRILLNKLTTDLSTVFKNNKLAQGTIFKQYCPMANSGKGAYWFANEETINNPYYGSAMLNCGSVDEEIK